MECGRTPKEPDNQSSGKATTKITCKTAAAASTFQRGNKDPFDNDSNPLASYQFSYFVQDRHEARLADVRATFAVEYCDPLLSSSMMPYFLYIFSPQPTSTWIGGENIPDCYKSTVQVQPSVQSSSNVLVSHLAATTR